ncbi:hypothetical protein BpHYR1_044790 [Brachionus plicatilis]|uniref:Uncharacterized protein n=1 Tax=Brachionus plicatilis TaxID=10195 RepID=A0A3M7PR02_BRAPC|nr:hypothetical protein BpHYR1_044790 [Brachionus plicatilis]
MLGKGLRYIGYDSIGYSMSKPTLRANLEKDLYEFVINVISIVVLDAQIKAYKDCFNDAKANLRIFLQFLNVHVNQIWYYEQKRMIKAFLLDVQGFRGAKMLFGFQAPLKKQLLQMNTVKMYNHLLINIMSSQTDRKLYEFLSEILEESIKAQLEKNELFESIKF